MTSIHFKAPSLPPAKLPDDSSGTQPPNQEQVTRSSAYHTRWNTEVGRDGELHESWYAEPEAANASLGASLSREQRDLLRPYAGQWESWRRELVNALAYAIPVAVSMGGAHAVELWVFKRFAEKVLARALAVSLPYVFGSAAEPSLRHALGHESSGSQKGVAAPWENTASSALINWNVAQPAVDKLLVGHPWLGAAKLLTTAAINGARGVADHACIERAVSQLPSDALPADRQLTAAESLVLALMVNSLRSVFDVMRQSCKVAQLKGVAPPAGTGVADRAVTHATYAGGVPALVQPVKANAGDGASGREHDHMVPGRSAPLKDLYDSMNLFG